MDNNNIEIVEIPKDQLQKQLDESYQKGMEEAQKTAAKMTVPTFANNTQQYEGIKKYPVIGNYLRVLAKSAMTKQNPQKIIEEWSKYNSVLPENVIKTMQATDFDTGGALIPNVLSTEIIGLLSTKSVMRKIGVPVIDMPNGNLTFRKQTSGATAYWIGEGDNITASTPAFGSISLSVKKLVGLVVRSNDVFRYASMANDLLIQNDLINALAKAEDIKFIRGTGNANTPKGLRYWANTSNVFDRETAISNLTRKKDLLKAMEKLADNEIPMDNPYWLMNTRTYYNLLSQTDSNSNPMDYARELSMNYQNPTLFGYPVAITNNIPRNLGNDGDESEVYIFDAATCIIGDGMKLTVEVFPNGTYYDGTNVISGVSTDETVIRAILETDFICKHDTAISVITAIDWGA
jgi:HK97 family phage major capsid protein